MSLFTVADQTAIAANIRTARTAANLTVADLAERTCFTVTRIENMERGEDLTSFTVAEVARWLGITHAALTSGAFAAPVVAPAPATDMISRLERALSQCR